MDKALLLNSSAWPLQEARKLVDRLAASGKKSVVFETGYGPSGLPHIGTFGEVARTSMVRHAFSTLSDAPTQLLCFSDDLDGLRKVPDNIPNPEKFKQYTAMKPGSPEEEDKIGGVALTSIPDPFGTHASYGEHMNNRLKEFLNRFGFQYEFKSATECYKSGIFNDALIKVTQHHEEICAIVRPAVSEGRRAHYSPILPIDPETRRPLQVSVEVVDAAKGIIRYQNPLKNDAWMETPVTDGHCKLQWRADWAMRWLALGVDYEMCGKDVWPSAQLAYKIVSALGAKPPEGFDYELFLDEKGQKISKSKGNGLTIDEWLRYAPPESLSLYMYQSPRKAKRLYFDVIPRQVDDYLTYLEKYPNQSPEDQISNPLWHLHDGEPPKTECPLNFSLLLNLASACNPEEPSVLWGFIVRYAPGVTPKNNPLLDRLAAYAVQYYRDFVRPSKHYRAPSEAERVALSDLKDQLLQAKDAGADILQQIVYDVGNAHNFELKDWFKALYETLLGQPQGPRMGSFIALYGVKETCALIDSALEGALAAA